MNILRVIRFVRVALAARRIQDFLWDKPGRRAPWQNEPESWDSWLRNLDKRIQKLWQVRNNPNWRVEAKKRLLQLATVAVAMMEAIDDNPSAVHPGDIGAKKIR